MKKLDIKFVATFVVYIFVLLGTSGCILAEITGALTGAKKSGVVPLINVLGDNEEGGSINNDPFAKQGKLVDGFLVAGIDCGDLTGDDGSSDTSDCVFIDPKATPTPPGDNSTSNGGVECEPGEEICSVVEAKPFNAIAIDNEEGNQNVEEEGSGLPSRLALFDDNTGVFTLGGNNVPFTYESVLEGVASFGPTNEDVEVLCDEGSEGQEEFSGLRVNIPGQGTLLGHMLVSQGTCVGNFGEGVDVLNLNCMVIGGAIFEQGETLPIENVEEIYASEEIPLEFQLFYSLDPNPDIDGCADTRGRFFN